VLDVGDAVVLDRDVAAAVDGDPGGVEPEAIAVGDRPDGEQRVGTGGGPAVVAAHRHGRRRVVGAVDADGAGPLVEAHPPPQELVLQGGGDLGVLGGQHLLPGDDQGDLAAERREHVDELDAGHAGADHHEVRRQLGRRVGVAGREHPLPVDLRPLRDARPRPGGDQHGVGFELLDAVGRLGHQLVGALEPGRAVQQPHALVGEEGGDLPLEPPGDLGDAVAHQPEVDLGRLLDEAHALDAPAERHGPAGGDHGLRRDAVPEVGGAADDVALDHRDLGAEPGRVAGR
jgi:hypothetical protein